MDTKAGPRPSVSPIAGGRTSDRLEGDAGLAVKKSFILSGTPASPGYAEGPLFFIDGRQAKYEAKGSPEAERAALDQAIATAVDALSTLAVVASGDAADMLEFQIAMLCDESLASPAFDAIADGESADAAWQHVLDTEISGYQASDDDYFRARSADLRDIRDRVLRELSGESEAASPAGAILIGEDITPTRFLASDWSAGGGIALFAGSTASHVAMLARSRGVPMVVGLGNRADTGAGLALLDAEHGRLVVDADPGMVNAFRQASGAFGEKRRIEETYLARPAVTRDGTPISVQINIADPADIDTIDIANCDGVGLMRTEFLFGRASGLPDEESQYAAYRKVLEWAGAKPVTIRTVDAGGDKPVAGFTIDETNPFLGVRGIRLSLARTEIFRQQIRALLRAAMYGNLKVMFPMVAVPREYALAVKLFAEEDAKLTDAGIAHKMPPLGIMVEVPCVAIAPEEFADVAFFSIGSNDLTQYVMAAARDNGQVAPLNIVTHPAVLKLIGNVTAFALDHAIPVSLCGDAGGDPAAIPALLSSGLRSLSVVPAQLAAAKAAIAGVEL
jgi:phosphoenolpyruvate-protein phosphotransferase (PTS system enzyme I)